MRLLLILLFGVLHSFLMPLLGVDSLAEFLIYILVSLTGLVQHFTFQIAKEIENE